MNSRIDLGYRLPYCDYPIRIGFTAVHFHGN